MKVLVSDYDDTFYISDEDIENNRKWVDVFRKNNNKFIIATGRSYMDFKNEVYKYNFAYDYVILNHGATVMDNEDNILMNFVINNDISNLIGNILKEKAIKSSFCTSLLASRVSLEHGELTKINVMYYSSDDANYVAKRIIAMYDNYINLYWISPVSFEIVSKGVGKDKVLTLLLEIEKMSDSDVYVVGDGHSDIEMIKKYKGYSMILACEEVKQVARGQVRTVSELIQKILSSNC